MDKIAGILLITLLALAFTIGLSYYLLNQQNQTSNTPSPTPTPTSSPTLTPSPSETPTEPVTIPKPSVPEFTVNFTEHSHDVSPIYGIDQFTGENITIQEGAHYQWTTLDFTIKNQQVPSDSHLHLFYNIRYKGQYTDNWTEMFHGDTYMQQQSGEYSTISFLVSGSPSPEAHISRLPIPAGAQVDFQFEAMIGGIYRISPLFASGYEFRGETSGWRETQTIIIP